METKINIKRIDCVLRFIIIIMGLMILGFAFCFERVMELHGSDYHVYYGRMLSSNDVQNIYKNGPPCVKYYWRWKW